MYDIVKNFTGAPPPVFSMTKSLACPINEFSLEKEPSCTGCRAVIRNRTRRRIVVRYTNGIEVLLEPEEKPNGWRNFEEESVEIGLEVTARPKEFSRKFYNNSKHPIDFKLDQWLQEEHNFHRYGENFSTIPSPEKEPLESKAYIEGNLNFKVNISIKFTKPLPNEHLVSKYCGCEIYTDVTHPDIAKTSRLMEDGDGSSITNETLKEIEDHDNGYHGEDLLITNAYVIDRQNRLCDFFTWIHGKYYKVPRRNNVIGEDGVHVQIISGRDKENISKHHFTVKQCIEETAKLNALGLYIERNDVFLQKNSKHIQELNSQITKLQEELLKRDGEIRKLNDALTEAHKREENMKEDIKHTARMRDIEDCKVASKHASLVQDFLNKIYECKTEINSLRQQLKYTKEMGKMNTTSENIKNGSMIFSLLVNIYRFLI